MTKVGRNEPCPCGSGKKYKRCCGANLTLVDPTSSSPGPMLLTRDPRALERRLADVTRILTEGEFDSFEQANAHLQEVLATGELPHRPPATPLEEAQELMYQAWEAEGRQRVWLARRALQVSPDCADAYVLLAEEAARSEEEETDLYRQAVAAGERALGAAFEEYVGKFWGVLETRPYMRARAGLAQCLWAMGQVQEAIDHYWELLRLNPNDNQGNRYLLLPWLLEVGDQAGAKALLERYPDDIAASWAYGRALHAFREQGDTSASRALLREARQANIFVPAYLLGNKPLPDELPDYTGMGDEAEAVACAEELMTAWHQTPGALAWLERSLELPPRRSRERLMEEPDRSKLPRELRPYFDALVELTDAVCLEHLNQEYALLSRRLAAALCRKRPSPVTRGRIETWACGITYAIGSTNFLFDRTQEPHLSASELCALFGVSASAGAARAGAIRKLFHMRFYDPEWCLPSKLDSNPLAWLINVGGLPMDARDAPREIQEEALRKGLIPYLPDTDA